MIKTFTTELLFAQLIKFVVYFTTENMKNSFSHLHQRQL